MRWDREGPDQRREGFLREAYFGQLLNKLALVDKADASGPAAGQQHLGRFVESFEASFELVAPLGRQASTCSSERCSVQAWPEHFNQDRVLFSPHVLGHLYLVQN